MLVLRSMSITQQPDRLLRWRLVESQMELRADEVAGARMPKPFVINTTLATRAVAQFWWGRSFSERLLTEHSEWIDVGKLC